MPGAMSTGRLRKRRGLTRSGGVGGWRGRGAARCWAQESPGGEAIGAALGGVLGGYAGLKETENVSDFKYDQQTNKNAEMIVNLLFPNFALRSSGGLSGPWPRGGMPFPYGNVGLNHTSGRFRGFASCNVVRGFEVWVGDVEFDCATATGLAARAKKEPDRRPVATVRALLEEVEEEEEVVRRSREDADIGLGCLHECEICSCRVLSGGRGGGCRRSVVLHQG